MEPVLRFQQELAELIRECAPGKPVAWNVDNTLSCAFDGVPGADVLNFHYMRPECVLANWHRQRPIVDDETGFCGSANRPYREEAYLALLAGAAGYSNLDMAYTVEAPDGTERCSEQCTHGGGKSFHRELAALAHRAGAVLVVDGAQSTPHIPVDVQALDADFFAFSGHKVYGPMGIGVLYGREELLNAMPPFLTGGEMIESVTRDGAVFAELPHKFEAGTVNAADAVGLHAAIDYVKSIGFTAMHQQEVALTRRAMDAIGEMPHVHVLGSEKPEEHCGIITFTVDGVHPHDISEILASDGVAIRAGHHCAQPLLAYLKHPSTARASLAFYNTESEVDRLLDSISTLRERMGYGK